MCFLTKPFVNHCKRFIFCFMCKLRAFVRDITNGKDTLYASFHIIINFASPKSIEFNSYLFKSTITSECSSASAYKNHICSQFLFISTTSILNNTCHLLIDFIYFPTSYFVTD